MLAARTWRGTALTVVEESLRTQHRSVDGDGWFCTGDIAELTPAGALKIIDRKKNIFKLAQGEFVAVEPLESQLKRVPIIDQIWVHGDSVKASLVAVVVPDKSMLLLWAKENGIAGTLEVLHHQLVTLC